MNEWRAKERDRLRERERDRETETETGAGNVGSWPAPTVHLIGGGRILIDQKQRQTNNNNKWLSDLFSSLWGARR